MPSTAQSGTAQSAIAIEAGSGMGCAEAVVEKTPELCALKLVKVPICGGLMLANARAKVPPVVPASTASIVGLADVKETLKGGCASFSDPEP